ncbi:major facilitator superfamily domain-containing protein 9-like [Ptychodera flava]|uniref:major facilitator superfamily domain-containing protein 9-like n=1 Tax=Ptychodera flava TaxID=63121 RepID=UPI00396AA67F
MAATTVNRRRLTYILYAVSFLDLLGVAMIVPLIPRHIKQFGASPTVIGLVGSLYGGIQLFSSPIVGKWSDVVGRRWSTLWCFFLSAVGYAVLGFSETLFILIVSRILSGLFKHTMSLSKAYVTDITPKEERPSIYGRLNAISGIGFIIGPMLGGHIAETENGFMRVCICTASALFLSWVIMWYFIKPVQSDEIKRTESERRFALEDLNLNPLTFFRTFKHILVGQLDLFTIRFLLGFASLIYRSNFTLMLENEYGTGPKMNGYIISFGSTAGVICGLFTGRVVQYYQSEAKLLLHSTILQLLTILALAFAPSVWVIMVLQAPLSFANSLTRVCCTDLCVKRSRPTEVGAALGLSQSVMSIARMLTPAIGGVLQEFSYHAPCIVAANFALAAVVTMVIFPQDTVPTKKKEQ